MRRCFKLFQFKHIIKTVADIHQYLFKCKIVVHTYLYLILLTQQLCIYFCIYEIDYNDINLIHAYKKL